MLKNYLKIAVRNIWRNPVFSAINILGLSIGMSAALVIYLLVDYDFSFDKFQEGHERVYQTICNIKFPHNNETMSTPAVPFKLKEEAESKIQEIEDTNPVTHFYVTNVSTRRAGKLKELGTRYSGVAFVDPGHFSFIPYDWIFGSPGVLKYPYNVVLTEKQAKEYFPNVKLSAVLGRELVYNDSLKTRVAGIVKDLKHNTDFSFQEFLSQSTIPADTYLRKEYGWDSWHGAQNSEHNLFIRLKRGTDTAAVSRKLSQIYKVNNPEWKPFHTTPISLKPLSEVHFNSKYSVLGHNGANKDVLYALMGIAIFLLVLGGINFINLTTAQAVKRSKEIGVRKSMGSSKKQLVIQFLTETFSLVLLSTLISIPLIPVVLKLFGDYVPQDFRFDFSQGHLYTFAALLILSVTLLAGFYPALILSKLNPVSSLKNETAESGFSRNVRVRKVLTVSQFVLAQVFLLSTLIMVKQIRYLLNKDLGFNKDGVVFFQTPHDYKDAKNDSILKAKSTILYNELKQIPEIKLVSLSGSPPSAGGSSRPILVHRGSVLDTVNLQFKLADPDYLKIYKFKLLAGKFPEANETADQYVVNEKFCKLFGYKHPSDAVGKRIESYDAPIVGVVADFHNEDLYKPIEPLVISNEKPRYTSTFNILLESGNSNRENWKAGLAKAEAAWKKIYPNQPFFANFFDDTIERFYYKEQQTLKLLSTATVLAVVLSCLGLLGLVIYTTNQRTKEIGIRKILGASIRQLAFLLSKEFLLLVLLASVIAAPISWYFMHDWLQNFAYKTSGIWWLFLACVGIMLLIALFTLSIKTIKTALANPVKSLRSD